MLLEKIRNDAVLSKYLSDDCKEAGMCVVLDDRIAENAYVIIKVDNYYNSEVVKPPPSPDCMIVQECTQLETYAITIVELKSTKSSRGFTVANMTGKFTTCLSDFTQRRFSNYFNRDFTKVELLFVSHVRNYRRDAGSAIEVLLEKKIPFRGKRLMVKLRASNFTIKPC